MLRPKKLPGASEELSVCQRHGNAIQFRFRVCRVAGPTSWTGTAEEGLREGMEGERRGKKSAGGKMQWRKDAEKRRRSSMAARTELEDGEVGGGRFVATATWL
jgi:hypothetical protein